MDEAIQLLAANEDAKVLAGGQSPVPLLNMRLARPSLLIDLNGLTDLAYVRRDGGHLAIGALTRHRDVEESELVLKHAELLSLALGHVGHVTIRNRGTVGGSISHADPAAEVPAAMTALDAELVVRGPSGSRTIPVRGFFLGYLMTLLEPEEILTEIRIPLLPDGTGCAVEELTQAQRRLLHWWPSSWP
ncbi:FAD binding domain-containing protein [Nocardioides sp. B-3]|nr:FAD binding domain-containing protein [Nocardioides sp. B-3]